MIHIVGLYKCGTTWLLQMLAAHPEVIAWREFDVLKAVYTADHRIHRLPGLAFDYLRRKPEQARWMDRREQKRLREREAIFREMFLGRGWIPLQGRNLQQRALELATMDSDAVLEGLLEIGGLSLRSDADGALDPGRVPKVQGVQSFRRAALLRFMQQVRESDDPEALPTQFFDIATGETRAGTRSACKAADQIMQLNTLKRASPPAQYLAIIRDGRDAAISAQHYERLMRKQEAPWQVPQTSTLRRLLGWSVRAAKLAEHARRGDLIVLRYEDLKAHFDTTCAALFQSLGLEAGPDIVAEVRKKTDFSAGSSGRKPGESAEHILRKGIVGEWRDAFSSSEASLAWTLIGRELEAFGYGADGTIDASNLVLSPSGAHS